MLFNRYPSMGMGMQRRPSMALFLLYTVFALYFINHALKIISMPQAITLIDKWIILAGGILLAVAAVSQLMRRLRGY